jgi:hypothetical protein
MTTKLLEKRIYDLNQEVALLRSVVFSVVGKTDPEGEYRPKFISDIFARIRGGSITHKFTNTKNFLTLIQKRV